MSYVYKSEDFISILRADAPTQPIQDQTAEIVREALWGKLEAKSSQVAFITAEPGLGKTTGAIKALPKILDAGHRVAFLCATRRQCDETYRSVKSFAPSIEDQMAVYTPAHRTNQTEATDGNWSPVRLWTPEELREAHCIIMTFDKFKDHGGAELMDQQPDLVICDEEPNRIEQVTLTLDHFVKAHSEEVKSPIFKEALDWAIVQQKDGAEGITVHEFPEWAKTLIALDAKRLCAEAQAIHRYCKLWQMKLAYQNKDRVILWSAFRYNLPHEDKLVVMSATADVEGYHHRPTGSKPTKFPLRVDYSDVVATFYSLPAGCSKRHKEMVRDDDHESLKKTITKVLDEAKRDDSGGCLIVLPKKVLEHGHSKMYHWITSYWGNDPKRPLHFLHWGIGPGSNEFRDCGTVVLLSEHHIPFGVHRDKLLASMYPDTGHPDFEDQAKALTNFKCATIQQVIDEHLTKWMGQIPTRGRMRQIDDSGKSQPMSIRWIGCDKGRFVRRLPELYNGIQLVEAEPTPFPVPRKRANGEHAATMDRLLETLQFHGSKIPNNITFSDLEKIADIKLKNLKRKERDSYADRLEGLGRKIIEDKRPQRLVRTSTGP